MAYYSVSIPPWALANLVLSVEIEELGIGAGLQDRVAQAYQGIVYMNFDRKLMERRGYGEYEPLRPKKLPSLYIAYKTELSEGSEVLHNDLRYRFNRGDADVVAAMEQFGELTGRTAEMFRSGEYAGLPELMNANFDLRKSIPAISRENQEMVDAARSVGASAKFTGSGGAIIGTLLMKRPREAVEAGKKGPCRGRGGDNSASDSLVTPERSLIMQRRSLICRWDY